MASNQHDVYAVDEWRRHFLNPGDLIKLRDGPAAVAVSGELVTSMLFSGVRPHLVSPFIR
jgi:hypothetical protein